jgi:hypothetical protein
MVNGSAGLAGTGGAAVAGIQLIVPSHWWELPLARPDCHDAIDALVDERAASSPSLFPYRDALVGFLRRLAAGAASMGAVYAAQSVTAASRGSLGVAASVVVVIHHIEEIEGASAGQRLRWLIGRLGVDSTRDGQEARLMELECAGPAVRVRSRRVDTGSDAGASPEPLVLQYFVPFSASGDAALLTFGSPSVAYENELINLFDSIAHTFAFTGTDGEMLIPPRSHGADQSL